MFSLAKNYVGRLVRCPATRRLLTSFRANRYMCATSSRNSREINGFTIPIIDMGRIGLDYIPEAFESDWERVAKELSDAFERIGFAYISGHGIPMTKLDRLHEAYKSFLALPEAEKAKYEYDLMSNHGYSAFNTEKMQRTNYELHESYNFRSSKDSFPDETVPVLRPAAGDFFDLSLKLAQRLLKVTAIALDLPRDFFLKNHNVIGQDGNRSVGRVVYYPPILGALTPNAVRFGEHTDFDTFTFIYQDDIGGLQLRDTKGHWVDATPIAGTVVVNVGDMLQFWTGGRFKATEHRTVIPESEIRRRLPRFSAVHFISPNGSTIIQPLDGSNAFEPITAGDYIVKMIGEFYK